jgi:hypothetical protein
MSTVLFNEQFLLISEPNYCDVTPESRNSSLLGNGGKQGPAEIFMHATTQEPVSKQRIGKHNRVIFRNGVLYSVRAEWLYLESKLRIGRGGSGFEPCES